MNGSKVPIGVNQVETKMRVAFKMKLKPGMVEEYRRRHQLIWPGLAALLKEQGISEYSIFVDEETETLFAVQKITGTKSSQALSKEKLVREWWDFMSDIMVVNEDNSPVSKDLLEVFYLD